MPMRRAMVVGAAALGWVVASTGGCEAVLGLGSQTDLPADASTGTDGRTGQESGADSGSSSGSGSGSGSGVDSGSSSGSDSGSGSGADSGSSSGSDSGSGSGGVDSGSSSGGDGGGCTAGTQRCSGTGIETCGANGQWSSPWPCSTGACSGGSCTGSTTTGSSCATNGPGLNTCPGGTGTGSCCLSQDVAGGTYDRSYDGLTAGHTSTAYPATVSAFRLDAYEVTVGRFRQFVNAWGTWSSTLTNGAGLHAHLNGGKGLNATGGGYETGWDTSWNTNVLTSASGWPPSGSNMTWTTTQGTAATESLPMNGVDWYEAYAFCIWDGGFLPSEAEWNYAATGGSDQRVYPWSPAYPPGSMTISCTDANYSGCPAGAANAVGIEPAGNGKWGQSDLAGNLLEWGLDTWDATSPYVVPCTDCTDLAFVASFRVTRGGSFVSPTTALWASTQTTFPPANREVTLGFRCARTP